MEEDFVSVEEELVLVEDDIVVIEEEALCIEEDVVVMEGVDIGTNTVLFTDADPDETDD